MEKNSLRKAATCSVVFMLIVMGLTQGRLQHLLLVKSPVNQSSGEEECSNPIEQEPTVEGSHKEKEEIQFDDLDQYIKEQIINIIDSDALQKLGQKFIMIRKRKGTNAGIVVEDLYQSKSIRITFPGYEELPSSYIGRINGDNMYWGTPYGKEIETVDEQGNTTVTDDYGNDVFRSLEIESEYDILSHGNSSKVLIRLDDLYAHIIYEDNNFYYIDLRPVQEVYENIVVIDAGHGGKDAGAISRDQNYYEKNINLDITLQLKEFLDQSDIKAYYTRVSDETLFLRPRVDLANELQCDFFISVHNNASESTGPNGTEVLYFDTSYNNISAKSLGSIFSRELANAIPLTNKGIIPKKEDDIFILKEARVPAVLIEVGYMTNSFDMAFLSKSENRKLVAQGIFNGIVRAYEELQIMK